MPRKKKRIKNKSIGRNSKSKTISNDYKIVIVLMVLSILIYTFYDITTIGNDNRHFLYVFILPIIVGMIILGISRFKKIEKTLSEANHFFIKTALACILILKGFFISCLSFGLVANIVWVKLNKNRIKQSPAEIVNCQITKLLPGHSRTSPSVHFYFQKHEASIKIDHKTYGKYFDTDPKLLDINLRLREGIWNNYIVEKWDVNKMSNTQ